MAFAGTMAVSGLDLSSNFNKKQPDEEQKDTNKSATDEAAAVVSG